MNPLDLDADPLKEFQKWITDAANDKSIDATAMTLATASRDGKPSARMVLLKEYNDSGFVFFTNYGSRKAKELLDNPFAALVFFWPSLYRQIRIEGNVYRMTTSENEDYFKTRPRESQLGTWASDQSQEISGREALEAKYARYEKEFSGQQIPCPAFWGGFRLVPTAIEFWIGQPKRLHDRVHFFREKNMWKIKYLSS